LSLILNLEVEKLSLGGDGVARKDGLVYFIPFAAPGDLLKVRITEKKKNFARAEIIEVLRPGPNRQAASCDVFGKCGGCNWQHLSYPEQLLQKDLIVKEQLRKVVDEKTEFFKILPSPKPFDYRNRVQLKYDGKDLGFYARNSHKIVSFSKCWITDPAINAEISKLKISLNSTPVSKLELYLDSDHRVHKSVDGTGEAGGFSQVNTDQNAILIDKVMEWTSQLNPKQIYDLYAGSGNFSFPFAEKFKESFVDAVELSSVSVDQAKKIQISESKFKNRLQFHCADVAHFLNTISVESNDLIFLDPPRVGCADTVIDGLGSSEVSRIFYLSCNPATLARDIARMQKLRPWRLRKVQPLDMFPQTDHIETLIELSIDSQ
jgi:23S rRNA (uracil1939-C5)-methyltransferase